MATRAENERLAVLETKMEAVEKTVNSLDQAVRTLPKDLVKELDERYARKSELEDIAETVEPLTKLRKHLWAWVLGGSVILTIMYQVAKDRFLKG